MTTGGPCVHTQVPKISVPQGFGNAHVASDTRMVVNDEAEPIGTDASRVLGPPCAETYSDRWCESTVTDPARRRDRPV